MRRHCAAPNATTLCRPECDDIVPPGDAALAAHVAREHEGWACAPCGRVFTRCAPCSVRVCPAQQAAQPVCRLESYDSYHSQAQFWFACLFVDKHNLYFVAKFAHDCWAGARARSAGALGDHDRALHYDDGPPECRRCARQLGSSEALAQHLRDAHGVAAGNRRAFGALRESLEGWHCDLCAVRCWGSAAAAAEHWFDARHVDEADRAWPEGWRDAARMEELVGGSGSDDGSSSEEEDSGSSSEEEDSGSDDDDDDFDDEEEEEEDDDVTCCTDKSFELAETHRRNFARARSTLQKCAICLEWCRQGGRRGRLIVAVAHCAHVYHEQCLNEWRSADHPNRRARGALCAALHTALVRRSSCCPVCRKLILTALPFSYD